MSKCVPLATCPRGDARLAEALHYTNVQARSLTRKTPRAAYTFGWPAILPCNSGACVHRTPKAPTKCTTLSRGQVYVCVKPHPDST